MSIRDFDESGQEGRRIVTPYIRKIWDVEKDLQYLPGCLKVCEIGNHPVFQRRDHSSKIRCFGALVGDLITPELSHVTAETLDMFFRSKKDRHAEQCSDGNGHVWYEPRETYDWESLIEFMLLGFVTPATYCIGEDGLTVQCAFDIDNHNGSNPSRPRVVAIVEYLKKLGIEPIAEASGSPDSYHVYIPILRSPIEIVHNFMRTLLDQLIQEYPDLDFEHYTEAFPKQTNNKGTSGNALKLPMAINMKTDVSSTLLDPDTLERTVTTVITKVVELCEPGTAIGGVVEVHELQETEEVAALHSTSTITSISPKKSRQKPTYSRASNMRPCIIAALDKKLDGPQGHDMRIAIVCQAIAAGKSREEIILMFEKQGDFDYQVTARNVDYFIEKGYRPWKCEKLRDRCSTFVDCDQCPTMLRWTGSYEDWPDDDDMHRDERGEPAWDKKIFPEGSRPELEDDVSSQM